MAPIAKLLSVRATNMAFCKSPFSKQTFKWHSNSIRLVSSQVVERGIYWFGRLLLTVSHLPGRGKPFLSSCNPAQCPQYYDVTWKWCHLVGCIVWRYFSLRAKFYGFNPILPLGLAKNQNVAM